MDVGRRNRRKVARAVVKLSAHKCGPAAKISQKPRVAILETITAQNTEFYYQEDDPDFNSFVACKLVISKSEDSKKKELHRMTTGRILF